MNINDLTIGQARELATLLGGAQPKTCPFQPGRAYYIRCVTMHWIGRVERIVGDFLVLSDAAWIADGGRYHQAQDAKNLKEVEPAAGSVFIGLGAVVDAVEWGGELPLSVK